VRCTVSVSLLSPTTVTVYPLSPHLDVQQLQSTMPPLPRAPISVSSLSVESGTLAIMIISSATFIFMVYQAFHGSNVLMSEEEWLERVRTRHLPRFSCVRWREMYTRHRCGIGKQGSIYRQLVRQLGRFRSMRMRGQFWSTSY